MTHSDVRTRASGALLDFNAFDAGNVKPLAVGHPVGVARRKLDLIAAGQIRRAGNGHSFNTENLVSVLAAERELSAIEHNNAVFKCH